MTGHVLDKITKGIEDLEVVVVFLTQAYMGKVNQREDRMDFCKVLVLGNLSIRGIHCVCEDRSILSRLIHVVDIAVHVPERESGVPLHLDTDH